MGGVLCIGKVEAGAELRGVLEMDKAGFEQIFVVIV